MARTPYLYILMRTDLSSLNPGKAVAQGCHAANQAVHEIRRDFRGDHAVMAALARWEREVLRPVRRNGRKIRRSLGFGTTICLGVDRAQLDRAVRAARRAGLPAGITHDPTYPVIVRRGRRKHLRLIPVDTAGYVFGFKEDAAPFVGRYGLHP